MQPFHVITGLTLHLNFSSIHAGCLLCLKSSRRVPRIRKFIFLGVPDEYGQSAKHGATKLSEKHKLKSFQRWGFTWPQSPACSTPEMDSVHSKYAL